LKINLRWIQRYLSSLMDVGMLMPFAGALTLSTPPVLKMSSPGPRQSGRDRKSSSLISAGEFATPQDKF
jgi:hypothetical protein